MTIACSLIISVLESYPVVELQCRHLARILPEDWEWILLDDGSNPPLSFPAERPKHFSLVYTRNEAPWTQPIARNLGARLARGRYLLFTDIDHILTRAALAAVGEFRGSRMLFPRTFGLLDEQAQIQLDGAALVAAGWTPEAARHLAEVGPVHQNTFAIRRELFLGDMRGGYDESLCAQGYGGDDVEFNGRYAHLISAGQAERDCHGPGIHVFPDRPESGRFHRLARKSARGDLQ